MMARLARVATVVAISCASLAAPLSAQTSPYVPLDNPAYLYIAALQARGVLRGLSLLERPLTVTAIRKAIAAEPARPAPVDGWLRRLSHAIAKYGVATMGDSAAGLGYLASGGFRGVAQTSGQRELMLADAINGVYPGATLRGVASAGRVVAAARLMADNRLRDDPDFAGKKDRWVRGRMEESYISAQWALGEISFGRLSRNWGPAPLDGAHLGGAPYSYDHVYGRLGVDRLHLSTVIARLDDTPTLTAADAATPSRTPTGPMAQRHLAIHRLSAMFGGFEIAGTESYLYSGVGRGLSFSLSNPLNLYNLAQYNERETGNAAYSVDMAWRTPGPWVGAQLFLDDFQVDECSPLCNEPSSWAVTATVEGIPLGLPHRLFASYTRVTNLVYRTLDPTERYASFGVGLGRAFTDYDELRLGVDLGITSLATTRVYAGLRRQGEGDYRRPFPRPSDYATTTQFLDGQTRRAARVGLTGGMTADAVHATWDLGLNRTRMQSSSRTDFEGRITFQWEPDWLTLRGATH